MPVSRKATRKMFNFIAWFVPLFFWLATAIAGWLLHFKLVAAGTLWVSCVLVATMLAMMMGAPESEDAVDRLE